MSAKQKKKPFFVSNPAFYGSFFRLLIPMALRSLLLLSAGLADNIMITNYSGNAHAAVAIVNRMQFLLQSMIGGFGEGILVIGSQYWGRKNTDRIKELLGVGLRLSIIASLLMSFVVIFLPRQFLGFFTDDPAVIQEGITYMRIVGVGYLFACPSQILNSILRSVENVRTGFVISIVATAVDIYLNYALIFGKHGFPQMGTAGAALSTVIGQGLEFSLFLLFFLKLDTTLYIKIKDFFRFSMADFKQFIRVSIPMVLSSSTWGIAMGLQTKFLSAYGTTALRADSISGNVFSVMVVLLYGASGAANVLIGKTIGEGKSDLIPSYARTMQLLFLGLGAITGAGIFFSRDIFLLLFRDAAPEVLALSRQFLGVLSITSIGTAYQMSCLTGIVRGGGDTRFVFVNDMVHMWGLVLPLAAMSTYVWKLPIIVVFIVLKSDQIVKCIVAFFKVNSFNWIREVEE